MEAPPEHRSPTLSDRAVVLLPAALTAWIALPFLRLDRWVTGFDTLAYSGPNLVVSFEAIRDGRIPQWNTEIFGGVTHLGNAQVAAFEPLMWLASPLPVHRALLTIIVAHVVILVTGMWWLLRRRLELSAAAAALGATTTVGSGLIMSRSLQFEQIAVVSWVPWVLVGVDLALDPRCTRRALVLLPVTAALLGISGHPQQVYLALPLVAIWAVGRFLDRRPGWSGVLRLAAAAALAGGLASAQLIPSALALDSSAIVSQRDIADASIPEHSVQLHRVPQTVLGDITEDLHPLTPGGFEPMGFIGATAGALTVLGLLTAARRRDRWTAAAMAATIAFGGVCALGPRTFVYRGMYRLVPGFDLARVPGRWMLLVVIGAVVLAALGVDQLERGNVPDRRVVGTAVLLTVTVAAAWFGPFDRPTSGAILWWIIAFVAVVSLVAVSQHSERAGTLAILGLVVLATLELGVMSDSSTARRLTQPHPFTELGDDITEYLRDQPGRTISLTDDRFSEPAYLVPGLRPNTNAAIGVASLDGYDGGTQVTNRWVQTVSAMVGGKMDPELTLRSQLAIPVEPAISARLGVRWLLIDTTNRPLDWIAPAWGSPVRQQGAVVLLENPDWQAEARLMHRSIAASESSPARALRSARADTVVLEHGARPLTCTDRCAPGVATVRRPHPGAIDIELPPDSAAGLVVVNEQLSDGWIATVDGVHAPIEEADGLFIGVPVPDAARRVTLRYEAPGLSTGLLLSGLTLLVLVALLLPDGLYAFGRSLLRRDRSG